MATTTFNRERLGRKLLTPGSNGFDSIGRAIQAGDIDALGCALVGKTWVATTAFALKSTMQVAGGQYFIATVGGTTGASSPTPPGYGLTVTDGSVTWLQVGGPG